MGELTTHHLRQLPRTDLPLELARLHWRSAPGERLVISIPVDHGEVAWRHDDVAGVVVGGGFDLAAIEAEDIQSGAGRLVVTATRLRSLPDTVGAGMRLLVCGLNPSEYAADRGVGYARPGNRFWPAAVEAGIVTRSHEPLHALTAHGVGMTDLVKRATPRADMVTTAEYRAGVARLEHLVGWLRPGAVCFVGLAGWRAAVDPRAVAGPQPAPFAGRPAYVMPSTSGLNAHASRADLVKHLLRAAALVP